MSERVKNRWGPELGTVVHWLDNAVIVRWDAQLTADPPRTGEYRRMLLDSIVPLDEPSYDVLGDTGTFFGSFSASSGSSESG